MREYRSSRKVFAQPADEQEQGIKDFDERMFKQFLSQYVGEAA